MVKRDGGGVISKLGSPFSERVPVFVSEIKYCWSLGSVLDRNVCRGGKFRTEHLKLPKGLCLPQRPVSRCIG